MVGTKIPLLISKLAIPTIIGMIVTAAYNIADTYFVSQLDDTAATGAVSVVFSLMAILQAVAFTIGMGAGSWISRLLGKEDNQKASKIASSSIFMGLVFGILILIFGKIFIRPLMGFLGAKEEILPYAISYGEYILYGAPFMVTSFVLNNLLRSEGMAKFSMIGIGIGGLLNIALDPLFIFPQFLGLKTAGAALATCISQAISAIILLMPFLLKKTSVRLTLGFSKSIVDYLKIIRNGLPSFVRQGLASVATILLNKGAGAFGGEDSIPAIAAMGVVGKVFMVVFSVVIGFGQGFQPVMGYNYGAKQYNRVRQAFLFTWIVMTVIMTIFSIVGYLAAPNIIALFSGETQDLKMIEIGTFAFRAQCFAMPIMPLGVVCNMTYQSIGKSWLATFLASCRQGIFYIPLILFLPSIWGLTGIEITQALSDVMTFLVCIPAAVYFFRMVGKKETEEKDTQ